MCVTVGTVFGWELYYGIVGLSILFIHTRMHDTVDSQYNAFSFYTVWYKYGTCVASDSEQIHPMPRLHG